MHELAHSDPYRPRNNSNNGLSRPNHRMKVSRLPLALLIRYLGSGFIRFGQRPFRPGPGDAAGERLRPAA